MDLSQLCHAADDPCIRCFITTGNTEFAYGDESHVTHFLTVSYPDNYLLYLHEGAGRVKCA